MNSHLIAHLADIHIRLNSRFDEYKAVLDQTIEEMKIIQPRRIVIAGDLFHIKINMTPKSTSIAGYFLKELSKIAPVDIILGNHDMNEKMKAQGNTIEPLIELMGNGFVLNKKESYSKVHYYKTEYSYGIYFYKSSGLYEVENDLVYGVFSMWDNELIQLNEKEPGKKYIALYHNPIFGSKMDNGMVSKRDDYLNIKEFANYDIVMLGDIHKYQTFKRKNNFIDEKGKVISKEMETAAYSSSLIQQHFGESIDKGFVVWNIDDLSHKRVLVPNEYGYCKLYVKLGEDINEKINDLYFSANKAKTKIRIEYEEKEEDYSAEKERQIILKIKKLHGCENVNLDCVFVKQNKLTGLVEEVSDSQMEDDFEPILVKWMENNNSELKSDVIELSREIDKELNVYEKRHKKTDWSINGIIIKNLFSFPDEVVGIDFDKLNGVTGIFGDNFSGKSNIIRALIWILYGKILGEGENYEAINIYSKSNMAYGYLFITIEGVKYRIYREIKSVKSKKNDKISCSYDIKFQYFKNNDWKDCEKEEGATEKTQSKQLIEETIGDFDDFTKVCLQTQGGKFDYLGLSQQPKNDLINKYVGLEIFRHKYELANNRFKEIKNTQKHLGNLDSIIKEINELQENRKNLEQDLSAIEKEKLENQHEYEKVNNEIIEFSKKLIPIKDKIEYTEEKLDYLINQVEINIASDLNKTIELEDWLSNNSKKEVPVDNPSEYNKSSLESKLKTKESSFRSYKENFLSTETWIKENPKKQEIDVTNLENDLEKFREAIKKLSDTREIAKGKKCPTCGSEQQKADPELEKKCDERIKKGNESVQEILSKINENKLNIKHNILHDKNVNTLDSYKNNLTSIHQEIKDIKLKLELSEKVNEIMSFNSVFDKNNSDLKVFYKNKIDNEKKITELKNKKQILVDNKSAIENNSKIEEEISNLKDVQKNYKLNIYNIDNSIRDVSGKIMLAVNNIETLTNRLESIKKAENDYKKYSIYLQAVHRDGIPSEIIKRKIPIINSKINNIISKIANFKVELEIKENGDIKEFFYFNDDKSDKLSLSMGSGSQKFISTVAIRDALHFVSCLTKPSFCAIDEGFDTLDAEKKQSIIDVLEYLKGKYKNILIITHLTEIKDIVENEIKTHRNEYEENGEIKWFTELTVD